MTRLALVLTLATLPALAAPPAVIQTARASAGGATTTAVFAAPPATGDLLVALVGYYSGADPLATPSGWTLLKQQYGNGGGGTTGFTSFWHFVAAAEANSYAFPNGGNSSNVTVLDIAGADAYHPIAAAATNAQAPTVTSVATPALTPTVLGSLPIAAIATEGGAPITGVSTAGYTYIAGATPTGHTVGVAYGPAAADTTTPLAATFTTTYADTYGLAAFTVLVAPAGTTGHTPTAFANGPYSTVTNLGLQYDSTGTSDPRGETLTYTWSFGDGTTGTGATPLHTYAAQGSYTVSLTVTNTDGYSSAAATATVFVGQNCSVVSLGDYGAMNGFVPDPLGPWHVDVSGFPVDPMSNTIATSDFLNGHLHPDFGGAGTYGIPYTVVDSSVTPFVPITFDTRPGSQIPIGENDVAVYPIPYNIRIEGQPPDATVVGDQHAIAFDKHTCTDYELWHTERNPTDAPTVFRAASGTIWDLTRTEQRPYGMTSVDVAGLSVFMGLIRYDEIQAGVINHAIRMTADRTKGGPNGGPFVSPATHASGGYINGINIIMGQRFRLDPSYDISGFPPQAKIIATAAKKYGFIMADNGANLYFQGTPDLRWDDDDLGHLKSIPATAIQLLNVPIAANYTDGVAPFYPFGPVEDATHHPTVAPPTNNLVASATSITPGQSVTLTPQASGNASYSYIDQLGFVRPGVPITVTPTQTTTYTMTSANNAAQRDYSGDMFRPTSSVTVTVTPPTVKLPFFWGH